MIAPLLSLPALQRTVQVVFLTVVVAMLTACAVPTMKPEQAAMVRNVGVISLLPTDLVYDKIGVTVFNNERATRPIGDAFNSAARLGAERVLKAGGRTVVPLSVDTRALGVQLYSRSLVMRFSSERIQKQLAALAKENKLDAIVLVAETFDSDNGLRGVRLFLRAGFGDIRFATARPDLSTTLVDANGEVIAIKGNAIGVAVERPQRQPWAYSLEENLDAGTNEFVSATMQRIIESVVADRVREMGF